MMNACNKKESQMSVETGVAGSALIKWVGAPVLLGALAAALGFLVLPPRTRAELMARLVVTIGCSAIFGPLLFFWFLSEFPEVLTETMRLAAFEEMYIWLMLSAPFLVLGGLPGWWVLGAALRWIDKRRGKDLGEIVSDARKDFWP